MTARPLFALACVAMLAGCADRASMETPPVQVATAKGPVTCQLYRRDIVMWDESVLRPDAMDKAEADGICRAEGKRLKAAR
jgi:uncharacterized lipoprotein YehR (DUF1307 family)